RNEPLTKRSYRRQTVGLDGRHTAEVCKSSHAPAIPRSGERSYIQSVIDLAIHEDGGAYTLSYVMVVPILMLLICLIIETTLMMSAKVGTVHAAFSAARAASVWTSASDNWGIAEQRIEAAAVQSFVPFASGISLGTGNDSDQADDYVSAYEEYAQKPVSQKYASRKYANAKSLLTVTVDERPREWNSEIKVTVAYRFPFNVPGIGKLLGEPGEGGKYFYELKSQATLQNDGPQNRNQDLGIGYGIID
ncbi:MAG: TadE/TadG family type IV pilus assembly protein, partial [Planctomycetota bacterium]